MNAENYTTADWQTDIQAAKDAHLDAFALNMAVDSRIGQILPTAFEVASDLKFSLFFSFDYAGNGAWKADDVAALLEEYTASTSYYLHNGQYLVSTFEGPNQAEDWIDLKQKYNAFFIPDWSSIGAKPALQLGGGVADGLFSWAAWPWGPQDIDTYTDASYYQYLNGSGTKPYMMAVSPWFFTNLPGYDKNWLWRGDDLWYDRWVEVLYNQPEFVQIISWNDYGESHYIGLLYDYAMEAFKIGKAPSNFATDMPHDVSIGGVVQEGSWTWVLDGKVGIYHGSVPFTGTGEVVVTISCDRSMVGYPIAGEDASYSGLCAFNYNLGTDSGSGTDGGSANGQQANLPLDYDGPDGSSNGDWNPTPIRVEVATSMTSSISAEFAKATPILDSAVSSMIASKTIPSDLKNSASATASSIKDTMATHVSDLEAKIKAADPNNSGLGWFGSILDNFNSNIDSAIDAINDGRAEIKLSLGIYGAQTDVELINREIRIEAGEDICDSTAEGGGSSSHPSRKRAAPPSCAPFYQGDPGQASNAADIPQWTGCDTHLGFEYASTDSIKAAMTQGIKYLLSPVQGPQRPGQGPWQIATRAMYPHAYGNSDDISFTSDCENAVAGYTDLIEFPIMPDGSVLEAGKNAGRGGVPNVGVQRVVFKAKAERDPFAADWNYIFCGVMSHFTTEKVKVVIGDDESW
ncbi:CAZyme family GH71 [Penicillium roqueforti]|nr:CAZyme family GH71 [Penicillium roqueforti]